MLVIPAVDILDGKCVRLFQGDPNKKKIYYEDPLIAAKNLERQGAQIIHIIDLDAALGSGQNIEEIKRILGNINSNVQIGGGIRTLEKAHQLLKLGANRVIFGTAAVKNPDLVKKAVNLFGSKSIGVAIDEKDGKVAVHGWKNKSELNYIDFAKCFEPINVSALIFTPISVDGTLIGPQLEKTLNLVESVNLPIIASGGVANLKDLVALNKTGVEGVIVGAAIYEKKFTFKEAMETLKNAC